VKKFKNSFLVERYTIGPKQGEKILIKSFPPWSRGNTHRHVTNKNTFKPNVQKILELPKPAFKPPKGKMIQSPLALLVGASKKKAKYHGFL
jgi:hypothetical protein